MLNRFDARTYPRPLLDPDPADQDGAMYTGALVAGRHDCSLRAADKVRRPAPPYGHSRLVHRWLQNSAHLVSDLTVDHANPGDQEQL
jgi:hypothetical protein